MDPIHETHVLLEAAIRLALRAARRGDVAVTAHWLNHAYDLWDLCEAQGLQLGIRPDAKEVPPPALSQAFRYWLITVPPKARADAPFN